MHLKKLKTIIQTINPLVGTLLARRAMRLISQLHTISNCKTNPKTALWLHTTIREPNANVKLTKKKRGKKLVRNLSNGETFETGMVNWKTRVYKIFLFARPQTICTLRYRVLWGFMLRHRRGEFHSTKVLFSPRTASLCPATRVHRNEKRFPRFRLQLLCFVEFHSIFLNKYFFFFRILMEK